MSRRDSGHAVRRASSKPASLSNSTRAWSDSTFPGSPWNFERGWTQGRQPNINSEFGNVWGYEGSTGDVDYSWV